MTWLLHADADRTRFYVRLELALAGWAIGGMVLGRLLALTGPAAYVIVMGGMLGILGAAMRHPTYLQLRGWVKAS